MKVTSFLNSLAGEPVTIIGAAPGDWLNNYYHLLPSSVVIALDSAAKKLNHDQIHYDIHLGDFDSFPQYRQHESYFWTDNATGGDTLVVPTPDQNFSDLEKAIQFCDQFQLAPIDIYAVIGGRLDHELLNISILKKNYQPQRPIRIIHENQQLFYVENDTVTITGKPGDYCGFFGFPTATITTSGLAYECQQFLCELGVTHSSSNRLVGDKGEIKIDGQAILIAPSSSPLMADIFVKNALKSVRY